MAPPSFYSIDELDELGINKIGRDVSISRLCSLYSTEQMQIGDHVRIDDFSILSGQVMIGSNVH
ncbi:MAG: hypothetical protein ACRERV_09290, partial [Methylococcales bacterium]